MRLMAVQGLGEEHAVRRAHAEIDQRRVEAEGRGELDGVPGVPRGRDLQAQAGEPDVEHVQDLGVVVDDENPALHRRLEAEVHALEHFEIRAELLRLSEEPGQLGLALGQLLLNPGQFGRARREVAAQPIQLALGVLGLRLQAEHLGFEPGRLVARGGSVPSMSLVATTRGVALSSGYWRAKSE